MTEVLWLLLQEEPSTLTCEECFAVMEYYAELLAQGGRDLLPAIMQHLDGCPSCQIEHRAALQRLIIAQGSDRRQTDMAPAQQLQKMNEPSETWAKGVDGAGQTTPAYPTE